ncbi:MAG: hypothetical protein WBC43_14550 [Olleya sp.]
MDSIIQEGYDIMKVAKWDSDTRTLYWKQKADERSELLESKRLQEEQYKHGFDNGKLKGEIKGEISKVKDFLDLKLKQEDILKRMHYLNKKGPEKAIESINYIQDHINDSPYAKVEKIGQIL